MCEMDSFPTPTQAILTPFLLERRMTSAGGLIKHEVISRLSLEQELIINSDFHVVLADAVR